MLETGKFQRCTGCDGIFEPGDLILGAGNTRWCGGCAEAETERAPARAPAFDRILEDDGEP